MKPKWIKLRRIALNSKAHCIVAVLYTMLGSLSPLELLLLCQAKSYFFWVQSCCWLSNIFHILVAVVSMTTNQTESWNSSTPGFYSWNFLLTAAILSGFLRWQKWAAYLISCVNARHDRKFKILKANGQWWVALSSLLAETLKVNKIVKNRHLKVGNIFYIYF